jgi:Ricin-type beta-trefoil lectin domain
VISDQGGQVKIIRATVIGLSLACAVATAAGTAVTAPAIAASNHAASSVPQTCHVWRALYGPWVAIDSYHNRSLAWTTAGAEGSPVYLGRYTGSLHQCWKILGGFGNSEHEFSLAHSPMCLRVHNGDRHAGAYLETYPCLSYPSELFTAIESHNRVMWKNVQSGLCVTADAGITSGSTLDQQGCTNYATTQSWWINTSP